MRIRRPIALLVGVSSSLLITNLEAQEPRLASFTATKIESFYRPDGTHARNEEFIDAFRMDGSSVRIRRFFGPDGVRAEQRTLVDLPARKETSADGLTESITTMWIHDQKAHRLSHNYHTSSCADVNSPPNMAGPQTGRRANMLGYEVILFEGFLPGPGAERSRVESWRAPALDCYPLKETFFVGGVATNVREVMSVTAGEPEAGIFQVPTGYTERSPSQVLEKFRHRYPARAKSVCATCPSAAQADTGYYRNR